MTVTVILFIKNIFLENFTTGPNPTHTHAAVKAFWSVNDASVLLQSNMSVCRSVRVLFMVFNRPEVIRYRQPTRQPRKHPSFVTECSVTRKPTALQAIFTHGFLADRTATQYDRLSASSCRPSVCNTVHCGS